MNESIVKEIVAEVVARCLEGSADSGGGQSLDIPVEVSARHVHLCQRHVRALFGEGYRLTKKQELSQPGQYLCEERITIIGEKGQLRNVAILGPVRERTQVEISFTDARVLGVSPPARLSGELEGAADVYLMAGKNLILAEEAVIAARNHVHMTPEDAKRFQVSDGDAVSLRVNGARPVVFGGAAVRVSEHAKLAFHIDADEANACGWLTGTRAVFEGKGRAPESRERRAKTAPRSEIFKKKMVAAKDAEDWVKEGKRQLTLGKGTILTPLARDVLRDAKVELVYAGESGEEGAR